MILVDPESPTPPYEQVRSQYAALIASGELPAGTRLPTVRGLAADLGLAANTIARAYRELETGGLVETRGRGGTVVSARGDEARSAAVDAARTYAAKVASLGISQADALGIVRAAIDG